MLKALANFLLYTICYNILEEFAVNNRIINVLREETSPHNAEVQGPDAFSYLSLIPTQPPSPQHGVVNIIDAHKNGW